MQFAPHLTTYIAVNSLSYIEDFLKLCTYFFTLVLCQLYQLFRTAMMLFDLVLWHRWVKSCMVQAPQPAVIKHPRSHPKQAARLQSQHKQAASHSSIDIIVQLQKSGVCCVMTLFYTQKLRRGPELQSKGISTIKRPTEVENLPEEKGWNSGAWVTWDSTRKCHTQGGCSWENGTLSLKHLLLLLSAAAWSICLSPKHRGGRIFFA